MSRNALIIFVRNPVKGQVKTRLAKDIGNEKALQIYNILLKHTLDITLPLTCDKFVFYSDKIEQGDRWHLNSFHTRLQQGADLGERMRNAFSLIFQEHFEQAVIIGSDCHDLTSGIITRAFAALNESDLVIGPAMDGGYYLLGMRSLHSPLLENQAWGTNSVFSETIKTAEALKLNYTLLEKLNDIDRTEDLAAPPFDKFIRQ